MDRRIVVRSTGRASTKPDLIVISMTVQATDREYARAVEQSAHRTEAVREALLPLGFSKDDVKTSNYNVSTRYESEQDERGVFRQRFAGYDCFHSLSLEFPLDSARLSAVVSALAQSSAEPQFQIRFTVKDTDAVIDRVLQDAAVRGREKANTLCAASGVRLGALVGIEYGSRGMELYSQTECAPMLRMAKAGNGMAEMDMDVVPEDIRTEETVTFTWEID